MSAPAISSLLSRSSATMTTSTALARSRNGMASAMARAAVRPPSQHDHDAVELEALLLDVGHDDDRPAGLEQRALDHQLLGRAVFALRLPDDGEVEAPRDAAEQRAGAAPLSRR